MLANLFPGRFQMMTPFTVRDYGAFPLLLVGNSFTCTQLIEKGADMKAKDNYKWTPLHHAAWKGEKDTAVILLYKGAEVNAKGDLGRTPLHYAAWKGHTDVVEILLYNGADVWAEDSRGKTPVDYIRQEKAPAVI